MHENNVKSVCEFTPDPLHFSAIADFPEKNIFQAHILFATGEKQKNLCSSVVAKPRAWCSKIVHTTGIMIVIFIAKKVP